MKTCAIINFWDGEELLPYAVRNWMKCVDTVIIVHSIKSNYGEINIPHDDDLFKGLKREFPNNRVLILRSEPTGIRPADMERHKRQHGLNYAADMGFTHFVTADVDEFYKPSSFEEELNKFNDNPDLKGLVCATQVYFKSPSLTIGLDVTLAPFIHKITPDLKYEFNKRYPFAWIDGKIRIDPTRQFNITTGVQWSDIVMHHYSHVRSNYERKIRNSTARSNLEQSTIRQDFLSAKEGSFVKFYGKTLVRAQVDFNIPEFNVPDIQPLAAEASNTSEDS